MYYADSMAFVALQMQPPIFDPSKRPVLSLAHLTSVPPPVREFANALAVHRQFMAQTLSNANVHHVLKMNDVVLGSGASIGVLFGMQHSPEGLSSAQLQELRREGVQCMAIAYAGPTEYGDGYKGQSPLTDAGKELIRSMAQYGIILDLSHAGHKTAAGALELIHREKLRLPIMASHSGSYSIYPHPRNLPDEIAQGIVELGGYIGVPAITFMMCEEGKDYLTEYVRHADYLESICGEHAIGVGSDCNHIDMTMEAARGHFENMIQNIVKPQGALGEYFPDRPPELIERGSIMLYILQTAFIDGGYDSLRLQNVCGLNFRDFLKRSLL